MTDDSLKIFLVKLSRVLSDSEKKSFIREIVEYCKKIRLLIPSNLYVKGSFLEYISFAYKHDVISSENTDLLFQMLDGCEDQKLIQELIDLETNSDENTFETVSKGLIHSTLDSENAAVSKKVAFMVPTQSCEKDEARKKALRRSRSRSKSCSGSFCSRLTDPEVLTYASHFDPSHWKQFAVIGLNISLTEVERIDYDCRTLQDKLLKVFDYWKNVSFDTSSSPPYNKEGLKHALAAATLNNLIYAFNL